MVYNGAIDDKRSTNVEDVKTAKNYVVAALDELKAGKAGLHGLDDAVRLHHQVQMNCHPEGRSARGTCWNAAAAFAVAVFLSGCAPFVTQSPGQGLSPVNAVSEGEDKHLMLFGHDVVSYFTENTHRAGIARDQVASTRA